MEDHKLMRMKGKLMLMENYKIMLIEDHSLMLTESKHLMLTDRKRVVNVIRNIRGDTRNKNVLADTENIRTS